MKIRSTFLTDGQILGKTEFSHAEADAFGKEKSLRTATDVIAFLRDDVSREDILRGMQAKYDGDPVKTAADVDLVLATLGLLGALSD